MIKFCLLKNTHLTCYMDFPSATPKIVSKAKNIEVEKKKTLSAVPLNNLEPITNIQIWLANGKRIVQKFNISHRWVFYFIICLISPPKLFHYLSDFPS